MAKLTDISDKRADPTAFIPQRVLVYGPPKTGKTQLVSELSEKFNLLWFDLEQGASTLLKLNREWQERVELVSIPDSSTFPIAIQTMLKVVKGKQHKICDTHGSIDCAICNNSGGTFTIVNLDALNPKNTIVVIDSLSQLTASALAHITKNQDDFYKMLQDDWGNLGRLMDKFLGNIQAAQYNVVCISHETEAEQEDGRVKIVPTMGSRNFSRNVAKAFDHVVYTQVANMAHTYKSMTNQTANIIVGSRTDFDITKDKKASLMDIFEGKVGSPAKSPGQIAASGLAGLLKK